MKFGYQLANDYVVIVNNAGPWFQPCLVFDWGLNPHLLQDLANAHDQVVHVFREYMSDVTDPESVGIRHLARVNHLLWKKDSFEQGFKTVVQDGYLNADLKIESFKN